MTIKEAKEIDMVDYLTGKGYQPVKISGINYWYLSPLRNEKEASFKINRKLNRWYDFGEGKGGNLVDLILLLDRSTIPAVLQQLKRNVIIPGTPNNTLKTSTTIDILSVHLISSFALIRYLEQRRIHPVIADTYLKEVFYRNGNKTYYALGFQNDADGFELRSPNFKGSSSPKSISLRKNKSRNLAVFEGFFDFLSYATIAHFHSSPLPDFLILNSTSFFEKQLPVMQSYDEVLLYLDNDTAGDKYTKMALSINHQQFSDERSLYNHFKDLNEWLVHIGKSRPAAG